MVKTIIGTNRASEATIKALMEIGAIYVDEDRVHASVPGTYVKAKNIPADRKSEQG